MVAVISFFGRSGIHSSRRSIVSSARYLMPGIRPWRESHWGAYSLHMQASPTTARLVTWLHFHHPIGGTSTRSSHSRAHKRDLGRSSVFTKTLVPRTTTSALWKMALLDVG